MANFNFAQLQPYALAGAGAVTGDTTITLKSMLDIDGNAISMASFGSIGYGTLEPGNNTLEEQISFTGLANNSNGTTTLSGVKSVTFLTPYTATSGLAKTHAGSTSFVISNTSGYYNEFGVKENNETITAYWQAPDPLAAQGIATKNYVDTLVNGGSITTNALIEVGVAGETISAGQPVYLKAADARWYKSIGTTTATVNTIQLGIAQGAGTAGVNIAGGVLRRGIDTHQSGGVAGSIGYVSNTSTIATSAGTVERALGNFISATTFDFDPDFYYIPTAAQKAAMQAGSSFGTLSSANMFITQAYNASATGIPTPLVYSNIFGSSTTQFDITNTSGTTYRYTYDGNGTDPSISSTTVPIGTVLILAAQNFTTANNGTFTVTNVGANFFEVTNASGVAENNKTIGSGSIKYGYSKSATLKYVIVEVQGGGGGGGGGTTVSVASGGGGAGGYSRRLIPAASLGVTETITIGAGGIAGVATGGIGATGGTSSFGSLASATGGTGGSEQENGGPGGLGSSGDLNTGGDAGAQGSRVSAGNAVGGKGGSSRLGGGGKGGSSVTSSSPPSAGQNFGGGGGGAGADGNDTAGAAGAVGCVTITSYFS